MPVGGLYNKGDGIDLAIEAGADLWHMTNYESLGLQHGLTFAVPEGERGPLLMFGYEALAEGSLLTVGDDGSRYFAEDVANRHGHIYDHGLWRVPPAHAHPHLVFDQAKYDELAQGPHPEVLERVVKADSLDGLAKLIGARPEVLAKTVERFNLFTEQGEDYEFHRNPATMRAFDDGPYYAIAMLQVMLNTQAGRAATRGPRSSTCRANDPAFYGAGELGGAWSSGRQNVAECLIFGKIAGQNVAVPKPQTRPRAGGGPRHTGRCSALKSDIGGH